MPSMKGSLRKIFYLSLCSTLLLSSGFTVHSKTASAAATTVQFTADDPVRWADGIAEDGDGGSVNLPGIDLEIYNISNVNGTPMSEALIYGSSQSFYALSSFDEALSIGDGWKGMEIREKSGNSFDINGFFYTNYGETDEENPLDLTVDGYNDDTLVASSTFKAEDMVDYFLSKQVMLDSSFDNVDEVRIYSSHNSWHGINQIQLNVPTAAAPAATPASNTTVNRNDSVTLTSATPGATIYYTTNGSQPTTSSNSGGSGTSSAAVGITGTPGSTVTVRAIAVKAGMADSAEAMFIYPVLNHVPTATNATFSTPVNTAFNGAVSGADEDTGTTLTYGLVTGPANGTLILYSDGRFTYTPTSNFTGTNSFNFIANDGIANSAAATVTINVMPPNQAPTATPASETINEDALLNGRVNGSDPDGDSLTFEAATGPAHGSIEFNTNGTYTYSPEPNYYGNDSFTFKANDGKSLSAAATVSITVNAVNDVPWGLPQVFSTFENITLYETLKGFDLDTGTILTYARVAAPVHGLLSINSMTGDYSYIPNPGYSGTDSFSYVVNDGIVDSPPAVITITVNAVNDAPAANTASVSLDEDTVWNGTLSGTDQDEDALTFIKTSDPDHGTVTIDSATGAYTYTPEANYNGPDSFTFKVSDASLSSAPAAVGITVNPVNDTPVALSDTVTTDEDTAYTGTLTVTDPDAGEVFAFSKGSEPSHGTLSLNTATGEYTYTPESNYNGSDSFTYTVSDTASTSVAATVMITVAPVNDVPIATAASVTTKKGTAVTGTLSGTDVDTGTTLNFAKVTDPVHGTVTIDAATGAYTYTPAAGYTGTDSFTFTVSDGMLTSTAAAFSLTIESLPVSGGGNSSSSGFMIYINGVAVSAGTATQTVVNGQKVTTVAMDQKLIEAKLEAEGKHAVITIVGDLKSDIFIAELNGEILSLMEEQQATFEVKTSAVTYTIPAEQINIDAIAKQLGVSTDELKGIGVQLEVGAPTADMLQIVEDASKAGHFEVVVPPVTFQVTAHYGNAKVEVNKFRAYVERTIAIPNTVDSNHITTGIVIEPDGTVRHVPTKVVQIGGKYYAIVNSLTNSTYALISYSTTFTDMSNHWAEKAVNDMGSRFIINGIGNDLFNPDKDITRAEFVAIVVRALGLQLVEGDSIYSDVSAKDWYSRAVSTAVSYQLINGFEDGTFRPLDKVTREQAMTIIAKAMKLTVLQSGTAGKKADELLRPFTDVKEVSSWAIQGAAECLESGIITGRQAAILAPKANMTRAEVATIIQRLLEKSELI